MDLSEEMQDVLTTMRVLSRESEGSNASSKLGLSQDFRSSILGDLIDINKINFCNDETWLYESSTKNSNVKDLKEWLYQDSLDVKKDFSFHSNHLSLIREITNLDTKKSIDSRTFTRPKKRLNRPSIEMYNEGYFKMDKSVHSDSNRYINEAASDTSTIKLSENSTSLSQFKSVFDSEIAEGDSKTTQSIPLSFDFSQPTTSSIFDKIVAAAPDVDSFQNMSPPSLVNSMCSSTFTNLMESSMIKNDPVLREIRDSDYSEDMLQDCDPPLLKSFTDSCSSLNSDTPEGFLKRAADTTFNKLYKKNVSIEKENALNQTYSSEHTFTLDCTYQKDSTSDVSTTDVCSVAGANIQSPIQLNQPKPTNSNITIVNTSPILNGTYRKNMNTKLNDTFQKSPQYRSNDDLNRTITIADHVDSNRLNSSKRHSYIIDNRTCDLNQTVNLKRNSVGYSAGSTDSLDYMSSLSNSSKGSNKMLNMAEVDAIVLQQEQSLQQVMSTPKPSSKIISKLWENNFISPITSLDRGDHLTDSEGSSNEDYLTVGSSTSSLQTPFGSETQVTKSNKSLERFSMRNEIPKTNPRSLNAIPTKSISNRKLDNNFGGSYSNLKTVGTNLKGSYTNLIPAGANIKGSYTNLAPNNLKGSYTNLKTMSSNLKGSYTQLKPVLANLPCTDTNLKVFHPNTATITKQRGNPPLTKVSANALKIAEVAPTLRETALRDRVKSATTVSSAKPLLKTSGLPRPVSSIPRPMGSRIPGPRTIRPTNSRPLSRPSSKVSMDCDF